jgi:hypothetical protein
MAEATENSGVVTMTDSVEYWKRLALERGREISRLKKMIGSVDWRALAIDRAKQISVLNFRLKKSTDWRGRARDAQRKLAKLKHRTKGVEYAQGSADTMARIYAALPHIQAVRYVGEALLRTQGKPPPTNFTAETIELTEASIDALFGPDRYENFPSAEWDERAAAGLEPEEQQ